MSFSIPPIQSTDLTAAAISTQVWSDKEVIGSWKMIPVYLDMEPPVEDVWETCFDSSGGVKLHFIHLRQTNTATDNEDVDVRITIDGRTILFDSNAKGAPLVSGQHYAINLDFETGTYVSETDMVDLGLPGLPLYMEEGTTVPYRGLGLSGHDIKVEVQQSSNVGAGARVRCLCIVETLETI